jgi:hypothetical protein
MRTFQRAAAVFVYPVIMYLGVGCEGPDARVPTASPPFGAPQADLGIQAATDVMQQLLQKVEPLPDGSLTADDPLPLGNTIHVVDRDNKDSWKIYVDPTGSVTFDDDMTCDPSEVPLSPGALHLVVAQGDQHARLRSTRYHRTYLRDLTRLDYYTCDESNNGQQLPFILLDIDWNGDNVIDDLIFFEPAYQNAIEGGTCGAGSGQAVQTLQRWQFWDALRIDGGMFKACYWALSSPLGGGGTSTVGCGQGEFVCSLSDYITQHPNAAIVNVDGNHGGVQVAHGDASAGDAFDGWVDAFTIGKDMNTANGSANSTVTYDFQKP